MRTVRNTLLFFSALFLLPLLALAATPPINFTVTLNEAVNVTGTPRIAVTVGGNTRYATYASGTGTSSLVFSYAPTSGDVDLDGVALTSPIDLNGGTLKDLAGNDAALTFTVPNTTGVKVVQPSLSMDFITDNDGRFTLNGTAYNDWSSFLSAAGATFTRASTATYFDSTGTLQTAAANTPRFDYPSTGSTPRGLLIERASTNYVRNSQFSGLTVGTNTSTANWIFYTSPIPSASVTVTATGTQNGIPYIDLHYSIPTNSTGSTQWPGFSMNITDAIPVSNGVKTIVSAWLGISSFTATGGTCTLGFSNRSYTSANAYITEATTNFTSTTAYAYRISPVMTHGATAAKAYFNLYMTTPAGVACDATVRLGGIQMEIGGTPTSYIPTTGSTASRAADVFTVPTGTWYNATEGTLIAEAVNGTNASTVGIAAIDNSASTGNDRMTLIRVGATTLEALIRDSSATYFQTSIASGGDYTLNKLGYGYQVNNFRQAVNGTLSGLGTSGNIPTVNQLRLGVWSGSAYYDGWIQKIKYFPLRTTDTQLQLLTQ